MRVCVDRRANAMNSSQRVYLDAFLAPLAAFLERDDVTDLYINRPGEVWLETSSGIERHDQPATRRCRACGGWRGRSRRPPTRASTASIPCSRRRCPTDRASRFARRRRRAGNIIVAIRRHNMPDLRLTDYLASGAFARVGEAALSREATDAHLATLLDQGMTYEFLATAVKTKKTIVIAGGTGTGKTTFLNALLKEAPADERFVLIEDTPEIQLHHQNAVGLVAVRGKLGEASVTPGDLLEAALRLRPDRIIMGEVRGAEAISWLRAVGTGHPGSITTVHANSPDGAIEQLAMMSMLAGTEFGRAELVDYVRATVDVFIQLGQDDGTRLITEIKFRRNAQCRAGVAEDLTPRREECTGERCNLAPLLRRGARSGGVAGALEFRSVAGPAGRASAFPCGAAVSTDERSPSAATAALAAVRRALRQPAVRARVGAVRGARYASCAAGGSAGAAARARLRASRAACRDRSRRGPRFRR